MYFDSLFGLAKIQYRSEETEQGTRTRTGTERIQNRYENGNGMGTERISNGYRMHTERERNGYRTATDKKNQEKRRSLERKHETMTRGVFSVNKRQQETREDVLICRTSYPYFLRKCKCLLHLLWKY